MSSSILIELHNGDTITLGGRWNAETVPQTYMYPADDDPDCNKFEEYLQSFDNTEGSDECSNETTYYYGGSLTDLANDFAGTEYEGTVPAPPAGYEDAYPEITILY